jgi:diaminopimelate decarboxylase
MSLFAFDDEACAEHAARHGTPCFVYSGAIAARQFSTLRGALPARVRVAYAVKANSHPELLRCFGRLGASFDCASSGELERVAPLGLPPGRIFLAGPGKREEELRLALELGVRVQAEGWEDLERLDRLAERETAVNLRVHPLAGVEEESPILGGVGPSAFGVDEERVPEILERAKALRYVRIRGLHVFAASNQRDAAKLLATHAMVFEMARSSRREHGVEMEQIDLGGGLGVRYSAGHSSLDVVELGRGLADLLAAHPWFTGETIVEPGRFLVAACGVYLVRVVRVKESRGRRFAILEGGINHLLRPLLTGEAFPVKAVGRSGRDSSRFVLAGPLCTSLDRLGVVDLPSDLSPGDLLAFGMIGAYGRAEAMTDFLSHPEAPEIWLDA